MNFHLITSTAATTAGLAMTLLMLAFGAAPGWPRLRSFALISAAATAVTGADLAVYLMSAAEGLWFARLQFSMSVVQLLAWVLYLARAESRRLDLQERVLVGALSVFSVLPMLGGLVLNNTVPITTVEWMGVSYRTFSPTPVGSIGMVLMVLTHALLMVRVAQAVKAGLPHARTYFIGLSCLLLAGGNDALVVLKVYPGPFLLDFGFLCLVISSGMSVARDFIKASKKLEQLSTTLEQQVEERTAQLSAATVALAHSERLAAIGQLAAGVAHEINNPAAVVKANLSYLVAELKLSRLPPSDAQECMNDSLEAIERIARIVKQLLDAGRAAGATESQLTPVNLRAVVTGALATAAPTLGNQFTVDVDVPAELWATGQAGLIEQVSANLLLNAAQAITETGRPGTIRVVGRQVGERAELTVIDDGGGIKPAVQPRIFEPFFTTRPFGQGSGLGLAVSLGLMRAQGGTLSLVESSESGTAMRLTLLTSNGPASIERETAPRQPARTRVLLVDDEPLLRQALVRQLTRHFQVECADGVDSALQRIDTSTSRFDAVVCDLVMPGGGGQRLLLELARRAPSLAERTLILTGGAVTDEQRRFLESLGERVLYKPLDLALLKAQLHKVTQLADAGARPAG